MAATGIGEVTFTGNIDFQIVVDTPGSTSGSENEVRLLYNSLDCSTCTTTSIILVGTCKAQ